MTVIWFLVGLVVGVIIGGMSIALAAASKRDEELSTIIELQTRCKQLEGRYGSDRDNYKLPAGAEQE